MQKGKIRTKKLKDALIMTEVKQHAEKIGIKVPDG